MKVANRMSRIVALSLTVLVALAVIITVFGGGLLGRTSDAEASAKAGEKHPGAILSDDPTEDAAALFARLASRDIEPADLLPLVSLDDHKRELNLVMHSVGGQKATAVEAVLRDWDANGRRDQANFARDTLVSWGKQADSIESIREAMSAPDRISRRRGCRRLGRTGSRAAQALVELEACLSDSDPWVRLSAIEATYEANVVDALPFVRERMRPIDFDDEEKLYVSIAAAKAVGSLDLEDTESVKVLNEIALKCEVDVDLISDIVRDLEEFGPRLIHAKEALARFFVLGAPSSTLTYRVRWRIGEMGDNASRLLKEWLSPKTGSVELRRRTLTFLGPRFADLHDDIDITPLHSSVARYLELSNEEMRTLVVRALANIAAHAPERTLASPAEITKIATFADAKSIELRIAVADYLGDSGVTNSSIALPVLRHLTADDNLRVRAEAADGLFKHHKTSDDATRVVNTALSVIDEQMNSDETFDRDTHISRRRAVYRTFDLLTELAAATEPVLPKLFELIQSRFGDEAAEAIAAIGIPAAPLLLGGLDDEDPKVRIRCVEALGNIGDPRAFEPLKNLLTQDGPIAEIALRGVSQMPKHCEPFMLRFIELLDEDWARYHATVALGNLGAKSKAALPHLLRQQLKKPGYDEKGRMRSEDIPQYAAVNARAVAQIAPDSKQGLLGIRRVLIAISTGRSWRYDFDDNENIGYSQTIDLIVELGDRSKPVIPELAALVEDHELLHPLYRFEAAFALQQLEPDNSKWRTHLDRLAIRLESTSNVSRIVRSRMSQLAKPE